MARVGSLRAITRLILGCSNLADAAVTPGESRGSVFGARFGILQCAVVLMKGCLVVVLFFCRQPALPGLHVNQLLEPAEGSRSTNSPIQAEKLRLNAVSYIRQHRMPGKTDSPIFACYPRYYRSAVGSFLIFSQSKPQTVRN